MTESNCTMVGEIALNKHMAIESAHFRDCEYADTTEGTGCNGKNLTLSNIRFKVTVCS